MAKPTIYRLIYTDTLSANSFARAGITTITNNSQNVWCFSAYLQFSSTIAKCCTTLSTLLPCPRMAHSQVAASRGEKVYMLVGGNMQPISVGRGAGFKDLLWWCYKESEYIMTSRATLTKHMEKHFEEKNDKQKVKLARPDKLTLALTSNCWTALTNESQPNN